MQPTSSNVPAIVRILLDPINFEIIQFLSYSSKPFYIGELKTQMEDRSISVSKQALYKRMAVLERLKIVKRAERVKRQHTPWIPFSCSLYSDIIAKRTDLIMIAESVEKSIDVSDLISLGTITHGRIQIENRADKITELKETMRSVVNELFNRFDSLTDIWKKKIVHWAIESGYFEELAKVNYSLDGRSILG